MSTGIAGAAPAGQLPKIEDLRVAIVAARWNGHITSALTEGALGVFKSEGYPAGTVDPGDQRPQRRL